jgi:hypothetical protein
MLKSVYDPGNINGSAFALSLHTGDAGDLVAVPGSGLAGTTIEAQLFELSINQSGDGRTIREGTDFGMGSSSSPTDLVWGTPSGNDVTVTSAGNQLPVLIAGQHVEVDHPTAANDGVYLVVTSTVGTLSLTKITGSAPVSAVAATVALTWYYPIDPADARDRWLEVLGSVANSDQLTASMIIRPDPRVSLWGTRLGDAARGYVEKGDDSAFSVTLGGLGTAGTVTRTLSSPGDNLHWARITSDATYKFVVETHIPPADLRTKFFSGAGATTPAATNKGVVLSTTGAFLGIAPLEDLILALSVSTGKIADLAVTAAKIATGVIAETHLAAGVSRRFYEPVDGRAANGNITNLTNAHSGKSIRIDQDTTLDAAFGAGLTSPDQAFVEVWNDSAASKTLTRGGTGTINGATSVTIAAGGTIIVNCLSNAGTSAVCIARGDFTSVDMTNRNLLNIGAGSTFQTPSATLAALGGVPLAGGTMTGALLGGGFAMSGFTYGSESVSGTLNQSHVGKRLTTTGTVTIPTNVTGWWAKFILGAVTHDFTFNSITKDSSTLGWGVGDHFLFEVTSATTAQMTRTPAANVVSF